MCGCLLHTPYWGPSPKPKCEPWLGIELVTPWFTGHHSIHWATAARANYCPFLDDILSYTFFTIIQITYHNWSGNACCVKSITWLIDVHSCHSHSFVEEFHKGFSLSRKSTKHHYCLISLRADGTVSNSIAELVPQNVFILLKQDHLV